MSDKPCASLETLSVKNGDFIILSGLSGITPEFMQDMRKQIDERGLGDCLLIFSATRIKIEAVDPKAMRAAGWIKIDDSLDRTRA